MEACSGFVEGSRVSDVAGKGGEGCGSEGTRLKNRGAISLGITLRFFCFGNFSVISATVFSLTVVVSFRVGGTADEGEGGCGWMEARSEYAEVLSGNDGADKGGGGCPGMEARSG
jgi:hypothetical protein